MSFFEELKRRNVVRAAVLYCVGSWLVLQVAALLFEALELPASSLRLVLIVLVLGFPVFLVFSWAYEITPGGLKRDSALDRDEAATRTTGRKIDVLIILLLVVVIAVMSAGYLLPDRPTITDRSIAVLPFANRSAREEDVFFVDGIHDDILTQLARIGSLTVISRTSVERFRGTRQSTKEIGALLGVKHILEGGVQRAGDSVRINVQLIDVATDAHLWAQTYDRELTTANIFAIQNEISFAIAKSLKAALSPEERQQLEAAPTDNLPALEAYFLGRQAMTKRTTASLAEAERHFERAIELDPGYALAYVGLAETYAVQIMYSDLPTGQQRKRAMPLIDKALVIDDRLGEAYVVMAVLGTDPAEREALYRKGLELAHGYATGHQWYGEFLIYHGRAEEALEQLREAARLDPLSSIIRAKLGDTLQSLGRFHEARESYEASLRIDPHFAFTHYSLGDLAWFVDGRLDEAVRHIQQAAELDPGNPLYPSYLAALWSDLGGDADAERWVETARAIPGSGYFINSATIYMKWNRGDRAGALVDAEAILAEVPSDAFALWTIALDDLDSGKGNAAIARYHEAYPAFRDEADAPIDASNYYAAIDLGYVLLATGETARGRRLLERCLAHLTTRPRLSSRGYWMNDVRIHAMLGNDEKALAALGEAVDAGWRVYWRIYLPHDPALARLRERPEFAPIVATLEADMAAQRERLRSAGSAAD
ncbi:MAG: tetratricopeptide repeat protein [Woeseia sp.]